MSACECGKPAAITAYSINLCWDCYDARKRSASIGVPYAGKPAVEITVDSICACRHAARDHDPKSNLAGLVRMSGSRVSYASWLYAGCRCTTFALPEEQAA
jgi:hypothetical protein